MKRKIRRDSGIPRRQPIPSTDNKMYISVSCRCLVEELALLDNNQRKAFMAGIGEVIGAARAAIQGERP